MNPIVYYRSKVTCDEFGCTSTTWHPYLTPRGAMRRCTKHAPDSEPLPPLLPLEPLDLFLLRKGFPLCCHSECLLLGRHRFSWSSYSIILCDNHLFGAESWGLPGDVPIEARKEPLSPPFELLWPKLAFRDVLDRRLHSMGILDPGSRARQRAKWEASLVTASVSTTPTNSP
jgi:hypothetical protein